MADVGSLRSRKMKVHKCAGSIPTHISRGRAHSGRHLAVHPDDPPQNHRGAKLTATHINGLHSGVRGLEANAISLGVVALDGGLVLDERDDDLTRLGGGGLPYE